MLPTAQRSYSENRGFLDVLVGASKRGVPGSSDPKEDLLLPRLFEGDKAPWPHWSMRKPDNPRGLGMDGAILEYPTGIPVLREFLDPPA